MSPGLQEAIRGLAIEQHLHLCWPCQCHRTQEPSPYCHRFSSDGAKCSGATGGLSEATRTESVVSLRVALQGYYKPLAETRLDLNLDQRVGKAIAGGISLVLQPGCFVLSQPRSLGDALSMITLPYTVHIPSSIAELLI